MQIGFIGKYPPIQGGVSRATFWMARALAQNGIKVHVITNAGEVEDEFRMFDLAGHLPGVDLLPPPRDFDEKLAVHTTEFDPGQTHIPWANPHVTKLASKAFEVVTEHRCDLLHAFYLEPYGMAACLASQWTNIPYGLQHAGSDIGRLFQNRQLIHSYRNIIHKADYLVETPQMSDLARQADMDPARLYRLPAILPPQDYFNPQAKPLDVQACLSIIRDSFSARSSIGGTYAALASNDFRPEDPTVGIYGKLSRAKGWFELVAALGAVKRLGIRFNFLVLGQDRKERLLEFYAALKAGDLADRTFMFPFIPPWHVPHFIRTCNVVCALEHAFPIDFHAPFMPLEVVACGTCLVMSTELAARQLFKANVRSGRNCLLVDPSDASSLTETLCRALQDRGRTREIGIRGREECHVEDGAGMDAAVLATQFLRIRREVLERRELAERQTEIALLSKSRSKGLLPLQSADEVLERLKQEYRRNQGAHALRGAQKTYQSAFRLLEGRGREYFWEFFEGLKGDLQVFPTDLLADFGEYLLDRISRGTGGPGCLADLVRYERCLFLARLAPCPAGRSRRAPTRIQPDDRLGRAALASVIKVEHDVPAIIQALNGMAEGGPFPLEEGLYAGGGWLVFKHLYPNEFESEVLFLTPATKHLLDLCDGGNSAREIACRVQSDLGLAEGDGQVYSGLRDLLAMDCIQIVKLGKQTDECRNEAAAGRFSV